MKLKMTLALIGIVLVLALSGCATPAGTTAPAAPTSAPTTAPAANTSSDASAIMITDAWARTVNMGAMEENTPMAMDSTPGATDSEMGDAMAKQMGAVYMNIANTGAADKLVKAQTDVADTVELHTVVEQDGVMQMRPVPGIDVPANGSVQLKPGGFHVMLIGVNKELKSGDMITVKLTFENAGEREIQAEVRAQ